MLLQDRQRARRRSPDVGVHGAGDRLAAAAAEDDFGDAVEQFLLRPGAPVAPAG